MQYLPPVIKKAIDNGDLEKLAAELSAIVWHRAVESPIEEGGLPTFGEVVSVDEVPDDSLIVVPSQAYLYDTILWALEEEGMIPYDEEVQ